MVLVMDFDDALFRVTIPYDKPECYLSIEYPTPGSGPVNFVVS